LLIPPLRERLEELPALIAAELKAAGASEGKKITAIHPEAMQRLMSYHWPGNLRELSHTVRTMTLFCDGSVILPEHVFFPPDLPDASSNNNDDRSEKAPEVGQNHDRSDQDPSLVAAVRRHVSRVYEQTNRNQRRTAKLLGISRATLTRHLQKMAQK
jgi:DNA-binding NtrC family response regulator